MTKDKRFWPAGSATLRAALFFKRARHPRQLTVALQPSLKAVFNRESEPRHVPNAERNADRNISSSEFGALPDWKLIVQSKFHQFITIKPVCVPFRSRKSARQRATGAALGEVLGFPDPNFTQADVTLHASQRDKAGVSDVKGDGIWA